jgi:hypothetical protein
MSALTTERELDQLREIYGRAEQLRDEAAEAERAAFVCWQEAYGAYDVARGRGAPLHPSTVKTEEHL